MCTTFSLDVLWQGIFGLLLALCLGDLESLASLWITSKPLDHVNDLCASVLWAIWKLGNSMIFNGMSWISLYQVWWKVLKLVKKWRPVFKDHMTESMNSLCLDIQSMVKKPFLLQSGWNRRELPPWRSRETCGWTSLSPRLTCLLWLHLRLCDAKNLIGVVSTHALDILLVAGPCLKLSSFADVFSAFEHVFSFLSWTCGTWVGGFLSMKWEPGSSSLLSKKNINCRRIRNFWYELFLLLPKGPNEVKILKYDATSSI